MLHPATSTKTSNRVTEAAKARHGRSGHLAAWHDAVMRAAVVLLALIVTRGAPLAQEKETRQAKLTAADGAAGDEFGSSVALDGNTLVVGAPGAAVDGQAGKGAAYVFTRSHNGWTQSAKLTASDKATIRSFGRSVALDGDVLAVTSFVNNTPDAVYVFTRIGDTWVETDKLMASDGVRGDHFGEALAVRGDTMVVGAPGLNTGIIGEGAAYVFTRIGDTWTETHKFVPWNPAHYSFYGEAVALTDDAIVVGAPGIFSSSYTFGGTPGSVYLYTRSGGTWTESGMLHSSDASEGTAGDNFGASVAFSRHTSRGDTLVVGAPGGWFARAMGDYHGIIVQGAVHVFNRIDDAWTETAKLGVWDTAPPESGRFAELDNFGGAVALDRNTLAIGAERASSREDRVRAVYVFKRAGRTWTPATKLTSAGSAEWDGFGTSVAIDHPALLVSAPFPRVGSRLAQGAVYVLRPIRSTAQTD